MRTSFRLVTLGLCLANLISCSGTTVRKTSDPKEVSQLNSIIQEYTESAKRLDPFLATYFNVEEDLSKFGDYPTPAFFERQHAVVLNALHKVQTIRFDALSPADLRTYLIFKGDLEVAAKRFNYPDEYLEFNQMGNRLHAYLDDSSQSLTTFPFESVKHYDDFVKRSEGFPDYVDHEIEFLKEGLHKQVVLNCVSAKGVLNTYKDGLETRVEKNPFFRPVLFMPKDFPANDRARLTQDFKKMVRERIIPGYKKFDHFFRTEYVPHCRKQFGIGELANGKEWYEFEILAGTNLALTPQDIHERGLAEVARIKGELEKVKTQLGFKGSLKAFFKSLTKDPKYFFKSSTAMFQAFATVKEKVAARIPTYFSLIPKNDYKIVETSNPEDAAGSYNEPTEMVPYGRFVVNTKNLKSVPVYGVTTLLMHETIPGHHFQLALQYEMKDQLSEYQRKLFNSNSFVEGWALYSEYLGNEMGMFSDPMQRLGNLNDEMLRAVRLVVDTGIHGYGWSRAKAIAYMTKNLASDPKDISNEVNRYSVWPGQALGYKIGQMKIIELRKYAENQLGARFNIKEFHKVVIGSGTVSLGILDTQVKKWVGGVLAQKH